MRQHLTLVTLFLALVLAGCGNDQLDEEETQEGWRATQQTLTSGEAQARSPSDNAAESDGNASFDVDCSGGGSTAFDGNYAYEATDDEGLSHELDADMEVTYEACAHNGITIDGFINYTAATEASDDGFKYVYEYNGDLKYTGDINGSCMIEMTGEIAADATGASFEYPSSF